MPLSNKRKPKFPNKFVHWGLEDGSEEERELAYKSKNEIEAEEHLLKALEICPYNGAAYDDLSMLYFRIKKNDSEAPKRIEFMEDAEAKVYAAISALPELMADQGKFYSNVKTKTYIVLLFALINELLVLGRFAEAVAYCKKSLECEEDDPLMVRYIYTKLLLTLQNYNEYLAYRQKWPSELPLDYADDALYYAITGQQDAFYDITTHLSENPFLYSYVLYGNPLVYEYVYKFSNSHEFEWEEECLHFVDMTRQCGILPDFAPTQIARSIALLEKTKEIGEMEKIVFMASLSFHITALEPFTFLELYDYINQDAESPAEMTTKEEIREAITNLKKLSILTNQGRGRYRLTMDSGDYVYGLMMLARDAEQEEDIPQS